MEQYEEEQVKRLDTLIKRLTMGLDGLTLEVWNLPPDVVKLIEETVPDLQSEWESYRRRILAPKPPE